MAARVLVVDDDPDIRMLLAITLPMTPLFEVVGEAGNGSDAYTRASELKPDVILMDVMMPEVDGVEATRRITAGVPGVRVIGFTASGEEGVREMLDAGAVAVLDKGAVAEIGDRLADLVG